MPRPFVIVRRRVHASEAAGEGTDISFGGRGSGRTSSRRAARSCSCRGRARRDSRGDAFESGRRHRARHRSPSARPRAPGHRGRGPGSFDCVSRLPRGVPRRMLDPALCAARCPLHGAHLAPPPRRPGAPRRSRAADGGEAAGPEASPLNETRPARREALRKVLDSLPDVIAQALALHFILGHTVDEIAQATSSPRTPFGAASASANRRSGEFLAKIAS